MFTTVAFLGACECNSILRQAPYYIPQHRRSCCLVYLHCKALL
jgi:hypothetical protein